MTPNDPPCLGLPDRIRVDAAWTHYLELLEEGMKQGDASRIACDHCIHPMFDKARKEFFGRIREAEEKEEKQRRANEAMKKGFFALLEDDENFLDELVSIIQQRMEEKENQEALTHMMMAKAAMEKRARDRLKRNVLGKNEK